MPDTIALARNVRCNALRQVYRKGGSHIGSALSVADILAVLYGKVMEIDPSRPGDLDCSDRFVLSQTRAAAALDAVLAELGVPERRGAPAAPSADLSERRRRGGKFATTCSGQGLPFGVGKALAAKAGGRSWRVFVLLGEGETEMGANWEALSFAARHRLDGLTVVIDYNSHRDDAGFADHSGIDRLARRLEAFGWEVRDCDGHDHGELEAILRERPQGRPRAVIARTTSGKGVSFMENRRDWHCRQPDERQLLAALAELEMSRA